MKTYFVIILFFLTYHSCIAQDCEFIQANSDDEYQPTKLWFGTGTTEFFLRSNGIGGFNNKIHNIVPFQGPIPEGFFIERAISSKCLGDILLICEITDSDVGSGVIVLFDSQSLHIKWKEKIRGFNIGDPLLHGDYLYLTSIGWVGKLNVHSGKYAWTIDHLYQQSGMYNSFDKPFFPFSNDSLVAFPENQSGLGPNRKIPLQTLKIDNTTGKIIEGAPRRNQ